MALPISNRLRSLLEDTVKTPQVILEIDGLPSFSSISPKKYLEYGDNAMYGDPGLVYGGLVSDDSIYPYINMSKSTDQITQQMIIDRGGFSSTSNFDVAIVDKDQMISRIISPGFVVDDVLARKARLFLSFDGAGHPQDSILFYSGIITEVSANSGLIKLSIGAPEKLKSQDIFPKLSTETSSAITSSQTTINVLDTSGFILPDGSGTLRSYIRIDDELIEFTGKTDTSFTGCVRGQLGTVANAHDDAANVETFYRLTGDAIELALKIMLSGPDEYYLKNIGIVAFNSYAGVSVPNSVFIPKYRIDEIYGVVNGDIVLISGSSSNDGSYVISQIINTSLGGYLVLSGGAISSEGAAGTISIKSKYNVLPVGSCLEMSPDQVDVAEFEKIQAQYGSELFPYDFYIKDQINGTEFINEKILYPSGAYSIPRKAKVSVGLTIPPLAGSGTVKIDGDSIVNVSRVNIKRSINKNFYNQVVYRYDIDSIEDRFLRGKAVISVDSTNRIPSGNKLMIVNAEGVRSSSNLQYIFETKARRFLEKYQFAAEYLDVEVLMSVGLIREIGDTVILDGRDLQITDSTYGSRVFQPRLFQIENKSYSLNGKTVKLSLVDTIYSLNGRYGSILPSSLLRSGSTSTEIKLERSYGTLISDNSETVKWQPFVGEKVLFRSEDWTYQEVTFIQSLNPTDPNSVIVSPGLSSPPAAGIIMDIPNYSNESSEDMAIYKSTGTFYDKSAPIVTGVDQLSFNVSMQDAEYFKEGCPVRVHNENHTRRSIETTVVSISGTLITVASSLGIVPQLGDRVELIAFKDGGKPYRYV